jgi:hypothetical protein
MVRALDTGLGRAASIEAPGDGRNAGSGDPGGGPGRGRAAAGGRRATRASGPRASAVAIETESELATEDLGARVEAVGRAPASERRRAALALVAVWRDLARDLALVQLGGRRAVRDQALLDDLDAAAARPGPVTGPILAHLARAGEMLEGNVSPELVLDVLAISWTAGPRG